MNRFKRMSEMSNIELVYKLGIGLVVVMAVVAGLIKLIGVVVC